MVMVTFSGKAKEILEQYMEKTGLSAEEIINEAVKEALDRPITDLMAHSSDISDELSQGITVTEEPEDEQHTDAV